MEAGGFRSKAGEAGNAEAEEGERKRSNGEKQSRSWMLLSWA
jgi:hypothetical protein